jgi:hypothetical protein
MPIISEERTWVGGLPHEDQLRFLVRLSFELTIAGRCSYEAGTEDLVHPRQLRRVNEIQHRVTACLSQLLNGTCPDGFLVSVADWVLTSQNCELDGWLHRAWSEAKGRSLPAAGPH